MTKLNDEQRSQSEYTAKATALFGGRTPEQILRPLWLVLLGSLLCCISVGISAKSLGLHDWNLRLSCQPIGAILVVIGLFQLSRIDIDPDYTRLMWCIFAVAGLQVVTAVADLFPPSQDPLVQLFRLLIDLAYIASAIAFCSCMSWMCRDLGLGRSANGWRRAFLIFCVCGVPAVLLDCTLLLVVLKVLDADSFPGGKLDWRWRYVALLPFIVGASLAFVLSIRLMGREMMRRVGRDPGIIVTVSPCLPSPITEANQESEENLDTEPSPGA